ncbi:MAG: hypothetical protein ABH803_00245 [Candidatus Micrarchaeota archaeon]
MVLVEKNNEKKKFNANELIQSIQKKGVPKDLAEEVVFLVSSKLSRTKVISSSDLKKMVLKVLDEKNKSAAEDYSKTN